MQDFIKQLLKDKGVPEGLDDKEKAQLHKDLESRAADLINKRLIDSMNPETLSEFEKTLDEKGDDTQAIQDFINKHIPNKEAIASKALLELRVLYLGDKA